MIVHFMKNKGGGSAGKSMDYMLGKDRDREHARVLQGNPELSIAIADNLDFKHKYTLGVLSFEEENISEQAKFEIMQSFEETLLAGLDKEQYNITWIEHTDKNRLELNFIIPKVDLHSDKAMNPYYDSIDRDLVNTWKNVTNHKYNLTNPDDPEKRQSHVIAKDLPRNKKELSESIGNSVLLSISEGKIHNRNDVVKHIEALGLEVARITPTAISIKDPENGKNIRLKGELYEENFRYSERYTEQKRTEGNQFRRNFDESNQSERNKLSELIARKRKFNENRFSREKQRDAGEDQQQLSRSRTTSQAVDGNTSESREREKYNLNPSNDFNHGVIHSASRELLAWEVDTDTFHRKGGITASDSRNALRTQNIGENRVSAGQGSDLHSDQEEFRGHFIPKQQWSGNFENPKINNPFENAFNQSSTSATLSKDDSLANTELLTPHHSTKPKSELREINNDEKRILEQIGELTTRAKSVSEHIGIEDIGLTERTRHANTGISTRTAINQAVEQRESTTNRHEYQVKQRESELNEHQYTAERFTRSNIERIKSLVPQQEATKSKGGMER